MYSYIARANIDRYLDLLRESDIPPEKRSTIITLLIEEVDKLSQNVEQLEFTESRAAACRDRLSRLQRLRDGLVDHSDRARADSLLVNFEAILAQVEGFCGDVRKRTQASRH